MNLTGHVHFRNKLMSTNPSNDFLCILIGWMQMMFYNVTPKAGKVNLLYRTSNRGHFLFHNFQICWVKSYMNFSFCAVLLILVCFWCNYTSALISCISYDKLSHNKSLNWIATHSHPKYTVYRTYNGYIVQWTWSFWMKLHSHIKSLCVHTGIFTTTCYN